MSKAATKRRSREATNGGPGARGAFTLVELLVVIVVIGVLVAALVMLGGRVVGGQKATTTKSIMQNVRMAIDQFATEDPLRAAYNNPKLRHPQGGLIGRTFGPYPPYQLKNPDNSVAQMVERAHVLTGPDAHRPVDLSERLYADFKGNPTLFPDPHWYVRIADGGAAGNRNNDMRALYSYLAVYCPGVLNQVPQSAVARLPENTPASPEMVNPTGQGFGAQAAGKIDVFGICDAWGVPLDYFLCVKLEYKIGPDGVTQQWMVTDRIPVLRSRGVSREAFDAGGDAPGDWILSEPFPQPAAGVDPDTGQALGNNAQLSGWAWAVPQAHEKDTYVPK